MFVGEIINAGPIPALELTMQFAARRQDILAHNIANISTPNALAADADPRKFQEALGEAIDRARAHEPHEPGDSASSAFPWEDTQEVRLGRDGRLHLDPATPTGNILFQDRNNRDVERLMQSLAENVMMFRLAGDLLKSRYDLLNAAIGERV